MNHLKYYSIDDFSDNELHLIHEYLVGQRLNDEELKEFKTDCHDAEQYDYESNNECYNDWARWLTNIDRRETKTFEVTITMTAENHHEIYEQMTGLDYITLGYRIIDSSLD